MLFTVACFSISGVSFVANALVGSDKFNALGLLGTIHVGLVAFLDV